MPYGHGCAKPTSQRPALVVTGAVSLRPGRPLGLWRMTPWVAYGGPEILRDGRQALRVPARPEVPMGHGSRLRCLDHRGLVPRSRGGQHDTACRGGAVGQTLRGPLEGG
jgi:hypothetical protein